MSQSSDSYLQFLPSWIFAQDYLVFLSFFGWMLVGLLAWTKPLSEHEGKRLPWLWFGYYAFSQAISDFLRTLSFSDPFFRGFNAEVGFEMLGYGMLFEFSLRSLPQYRNRSFFPWAAVAGLLLGLSIEIGDSLYTLIVSFVVSLVAVAWAGVSFVQSARKEGRRELYTVVVGLVFLLPTWLLAPNRLAAFSDDRLAHYDGFPYFGFGLLFLRILAGWFILGGFWQYRLQRRVEDVVRPVGDQLRFWGYRVLPGALAVIVLASFMATSWSSERAMARLESDYLFRSQAAALAVGAEGMLAGVGSFAQEDVLKRLAAIEEIGGDAQNVYLWTTDSGGVKILSQRGGGLTPLMARPGSLAQAGRDHARGEPFVVGPALVGNKAVLSISSPVSVSGASQPTYWIGIDLAAKGWMRAVSLSRLQAIIIAGLILALVIFFLYYQIDRESETDLVLAKERAEAGDRAKSEFLAVISHEIRTPLQSVLGYSDLLRGTPMNEKQMACLDTIQSEGKILLRIVQDILDFSNLRKASFELKDGDVYLRHLIEETYRTIRPMAERKGLVAELSIAPEVPEMVFADGVRLRQVLLNLFGNAVKYTEAGTVRLSAGVDSSPASLRDSGRVALRFVVSDTGLGIKEEDLVRLFEPFIQLEHRGSSPREGAGLGLAIVKRIIELMGGRIEVRSVVGQGSVFTVTFAFAVPEDQAEEAEQLRLDAALAEERNRLLADEYPLRILVVDDNPMVRQLVGQYLEALGYVPDLAEGGEKAARVGADYDLVVIDLRMPEVDGPTATARIRAKGGDATFPWVIAVSASLQENEVARARSCGVNDFLGKPFFAPQLAEKIMEIPWIESRRQEPAAAIEGSEGGDSRVGEAPGGGHRPFFVGPYREDDEEEILNEIEEDEAVAPLPTGVFGARFSKEAIAAAVAEVYVLHEKMLAARLAEDFDFIRETAHYLSNTAMALDVDQLYIDSKALQHAAEERQVEKVDALLPELLLNFQAWDSEE